MAVLLLVEDDKDVREAIEDILISEGHDLRTAANGVVALAQLRSALRKPDAIILDLMMPVMNGWAFLAEKNKDPSVADIPVIIITAMPELKARGQSLDGSAMFLSKPMDLEQLLRALSHASNRTGSE